MEIERFNSQMDWTKLIRFRNPQFLPAVVTQMFIILAALLVVIGLLYVICIVIIITIHHFLFDRDPENIPEYVKRSIQFSSEEEDSDPENNGKGGNAGSTSSKSPSRGTVITSDKMKGPTSSKKSNILNKFLNDPLGRKKKMKVRKDREN